VDDPLPELALAPVACGASQIVCVHRNAIRNGSISELSRRIRTPPQR
jgi:hypothetical protein